MKRLFLPAAVLGLAATLGAQVYSPKVLLQGQPDTTDLKSLVATLYQEAHATTDRQKAEAIWRFLLTNGRYVKPGIFYHIPGWAYEEPMGEVLDPIKLLNSYGFGLCYQDGPLLQALWDAGGFQHTRVWFLTGHTVAEVFYDGKYHYYDSDMMGYTTIGDGPVHSSPVASVQDLERDPKILASKLETPRTVKQGAVDFPWYNADVREGAIGGLSDLFTTTTDNYVYSGRRYPQGHTMDFVLRPGERLIRYYEQPDSSTRYMPYVNDGTTWREFPKDVGSILLIKNGPRSEKDDRRWSTGLIEYRPTSSALASSQKSNAFVFEMPSPYVILAATSSAKVNLASGEVIKAEYSIDEGRSWVSAGEKVGPYNGDWTITAPTLAVTQHGSKILVAGTYGYQLRFLSEKTQKAPQLQDLRINTMFEFNPRSLPQLHPGENSLTYQAADFQRRELPVHADTAHLFATAYQSVTESFQNGQGYLQNQDGRTAELVFPVKASEHHTLKGIDVGARFLDLRQGLAPDKLTAEVRKVARWPSDPAAKQMAEIAWSLNPSGPWTTLWSFDAKEQWPDNKNVSQVLRWPEIDQHVRSLPVGTSAVYVRYRFANLAVDDIRLAAVLDEAGHSSLQITHAWKQDGQQKSATKEISTSARSEAYSVMLPSQGEIKNEALIFEAK